jgi:c-di-GMP-binding flagellar brake protein YcgR
MTRLDHVRLQFSLSAPQPLEYAGRPALRAPVPDSVLRLQRREFFRLPTLQSVAPVCTITNAAPDGTQKSVAVRILDISGGGLAILVPPKELEFAPGVEFKDCTLQLPDGDPLKVRLIVRNLYEVERPNGTKVWRAGCQFVGHLGAAAARIQRYLFKIERDRKARESRY